jgi:hypothetical protein
MKSLSEFLEEISEIIDDSIKKLVCKIELRKMKRDFCRHEKVKKIPWGYFQYFEYIFLTHDFVISQNQKDIFVYGVRYWDDANEWFIAGRDKGGYEKEISLSRLKASEFVEFVSILKRELFKN